MPQFLTEEWFAAVAEAAADLPAIPGLSFGFEIEVTESAAGKVRAQGLVEDGRLTAFAPGKFALGPEGAAPDVVLAAKAKRALPIVTGQRDPLVSYMLGELKIDGRYELVVDHLAGVADREAFGIFGRRVAELTD